VTLTDIASEVGLAPSNVLRYFGTREEIYLQLLVENWSEWTLALPAKLQGVPPTPTIVAQVLAETLAQRPLFCDLMAYIGPNFEHNASAEVVANLALVGRTNAENFARLLNTALGFDSQQSNDLLAAIIAFTSHRWMRTHPSREVAAVYAKQLGMDAADLEFKSILERMLTTFIQGLVRS
jgi:AcrR family transcriptional regulator